MNSYRFSFRVLSVKAREQCTHEGRSINVKTQLYSIFSFRKFLSNFIGALVLENPKDCLILHMFHQAAQFETAKCAMIFGHFITNNKFSSARQKLKLSRFL